MAPVVIFGMRIIGYSVLAMNSDNSGKVPRNILPDLVIPVLALGFTGYYLTTIAEVPWISQASAMVVSALLVATILACFVRTAYRINRGTETIAIPRLSLAHGISLRRVGLLALTVAYVALIETLGFTLATAVFIFLGIVLLSSLANWKAAALVSVCCSVAGYVVFIYFLKPGSREVQLRTRYGDYFEMSIDFGVFLSLLGETLSYWWLIIPATLLGVIVGAVPTTPLDGYPMAVAGRGQQALAISFVSSVLGGLITTVAALLLIPWLSQLAFHLHSVEMIAIMLFGISLIATISDEDTLKGLIAEFFGLMIGYIGADVVYEAPRGTFGFLELYDKVPLIPALVGLFAISEALVVIERETILSDKARASRTKPGWAATFEGVRETLVHWKEVVWTSLLGLIIGVIPGAGAAVASFVAYQQSRTFSKTPELYGTGHINGLIAPESANNGVTSGTLIPPLILGVPGGASAAIMAVVLEYHGVNFGPNLFETQPMIAYGSFTVIAVTYVLLGLLILPLSRYFSRVMLVPTIYMAPILIAFTLVGSFVPRAYIFDMGVAIAFGLIGYVARRTGYHVAAILIGVILGPLLENYLLRAMRIAQGDLTVLISSTIGNVLWVLLLLSLFAPALKKRIFRKDAMSVSHNQ